MRKQTLRRLFAIMLVLGLLLAPSSVPAQQTGSQGEPSFFNYVGSVLLSILYFPTKLTMCLGTQVAAAPVYVATYGVSGNHFGGTNGREIGEVASGSCAGHWVIPPDQVKHDYQ